MKLCLIFYYISTFLGFNIHPQHVGRSENDVTVANRKDKLISKVVGRICSPPLSCRRGMRNFKKITFKFNYGDSRVVRRVEKWGFG